MRLCKENRPGHHRQIHAYNVVAALSSSSIDTLLQFQIAIGDPSSFFIVAMEQACQIIN